MSAIIWALVAGILVGFFSLLPNKILANLNHFSLAALILLLYSMGAKLGSDRMLMAQLGQIGIESLGLAVSAIVGSTALVYCYAKVRRRSGRSPQLTKEAKK
ncbi:MAG: lysine exporter LysO family protein [Firmicutes bacterium]|nr:lysine exporter LysO family protein [Bacillota bacterium]